MSLVMRLPPLLLVLIIPNLTKNPINQRTVILGHDNFESDIDDKRIRKLKLTAAGEQMISRLIPLMQQRQEHLVGTFSEVEKKQLFAFLDRLDEVSGKMSL